MSLWDRFRRRKEPPPSPPSLPAVPVDGTVESFDLADAVGAIRLVTGESVRFGRSACSFEPVGGLAVRVVAVEARPPGRIRATRVESRASADEHARLLDERDRAAGVAVQNYASGGGTAGIAKLGATTVRPIPDRAALRALWERSGCGERARLDFIPGPVALIENHELQVLFGTGPTEADVDARYRPEGAPLGAGFIGFWDGMIELARSPGPGSSSWGFGAHGNARHVLELMTTLARCRDEVTGVVIGAAGALWLPAEEWLRRAGDPRDPRNIPVEAFLDVAYGRAEGGVRRLRSFGMWGLALPDVEIDDPHAMDDDERHDLCMRVVWHACRRLAGEDAMRDAPPEESLPAGGIVTFRVEGGLVSCRVVGYTDETGSTIRLADLTFIEA